MGGKYIYRLQMEITINTIRVLTVWEQVRDAIIVTIGACDYYGTGHRPASNMCSVFVDCRFEPVFSGSSRKH